MIITIFLLLTAMMAVFNSRSIKNRIFYSGKRDSLFSKILKEKRILWVHLPNGIGDPNKKFPVVYLLDGDEHFKLFTWMIRQLDGTKVKRLFPDMMVVGILNCNRARDLTPTRSVIDSEGNKENAFRSSGGTEKFVGFIKKELIPHVESNYPAGPERMLIGHSLGGLTAINILLNHTEMFSGYIASDPSMWWDDKMMLDQARKALTEQRFDGRSLYVSIANTMTAGMYMEQVRKDRSQKTNHIRSVLELTDILENNRGNGLRFNYKYYSDHNHNTVPGISIFDGLRFFSE